MNRLPKMMKYLFAPQCLICHNAIQSWPCIYLCQICDQELLMLNKTHIQNTQPSINLEKNYHQYARKIYYCYQYSGVVRDLLHQFKYEHQLNAGRCLIAKMASILNQFPWHTYDGVIPMPAHPKRIRQRGLHITDYLLRGTLRHFGQLNLLYSSLAWRPIYSEPQIRLPGPKRAKNISHDMFNIPKMSGNFLIFDDVLTTGQTLKAFTQALTKGNNNLKISILCLSKTLRQD